MDFIKENAKAFAGALSTLLVLILKPFVPAVADPTFQPALEIIVGVLVIAATVWLVPNKPKDEAPPTAERSDPSRGVSPPIVALILAAGLLSMSACAASPRQQFVSGCSSVGEAMAQVVALRRAGKVDDATYVATDNAYDAAVETCATLPPTDEAAQVAFLKVNEFLSRASGVTGASYGSY